MDTQAKSGFKTFVTTLSISLVVFGVAYHVLTNLSSSSPDAENFEARNGTALAVDTQSSVFGVINQATPSVSQPAVLAAGDVAETTESTVPSTGSEMLIGSVVGLSATALAAYMVFAGPRKLALKGFENDLTK